MDMVSMLDVAARLLKIEHDIFTLNLTKEGITHSIMWTGRNVSLPNGWLKSVRACGCVCT